MHFGNLGNQEIWNPKNVPKIKIIKMEIRPAKNACRVLIGLIGGEKLLTLVGTVLTIFKGQTSLQINYSPNRACDKGF